MQLRRITHVALVSTAFATLTLTLLVPADVSIAIAQESCPALSELTGTLDTSEISTTSGTPIATVAASASESAAIESGIRTLVACWNDGNWANALQLVTNDYLVVATGTDQRALAATGLALIERVGLTADIEIDSVSNIAMAGEALAVADVEWRQGKSVKSERWWMVNADGTWLLHRQEPRPSQVETDLAMVSVSIGETGIELSRTSVENPGAIVIQGSNPGEAPTTLTVFKLPEGASLADMLSPRGLLSGEKAEFIGDLMIDGGAQSELVLVDLVAGDYTIVAGFRGSDGVPSTSETNIAVLTITVA